MGINAGWAKGYSRLGAALHGLSRFAEAADAYRKGLALDPSNEQMKQGVVTAEQALTNQVARDEDGRPDTSEVRGPFATDTVWQSSTEPRPGALLGPRSTRTPPIVTSPPSMATRPIASQVPDELKEIASVLSTPHIWTMLMLNEKTKDFLHEQVRGVRTMDAHTWVAVP